jgi:hypothetical protein
MQGVSTIDFEGHESKIRINVPLQRLSRWLFLEEKASQQSSFRGTAILILL